MRIGRMAGDEGVVERDGATGAKPRLEARCTGSGCDIAALAALASIRRFSQWIGRSFGVEATFTTQCVQVSAFGRKSKWSPFARSMRRPVRRATRSVAGAPSDSTRAARCCARPRVRVRGPADLRWLDPASAPRRESVSDDHCPHRARDGRSRVGAVLIDSAMRASERCFAAPRAVWVGMRDGQLNGACK